MFTMSPVHALDQFYLAYTLLVTVGYQLLGFAIAWTLQFDKITDFTGGMDLGQKLDSSGEAKLHISEGPISSSSVCGSGHSLSCQPFMWI